MPSVEIKSEEPGFLQSLLTSFMSEKPKMGPRSKYVEKKKQPMGEGEARKKAESEAYASLEEGED
jgi:hypothetical protein